MDYNAEVLLSALSGPRRPKNFIRIGLPALLREKRFIISMIDVANTFYCFKFLFKIFYLRFYCFKFAQSKTAVDRNALSTSTILTIKFAIKRTARVLR